MEASQTTIAVRDSQSEPVTKHKKRGKFLWYGESGSWKTLTALKLFSKAYVIDMEQGTDFYRDEFPQHEYLDATTPQEVDDAIEFLTKRKHEFVALIIDPITIWHEAHRQYWSELFLKRNRGGKGHKHDFYEMQPRDWTTIAMAEKDFLRRLSRLDMHVILTAHQTNLYDDKAGAEMMKKIGVTFAGIKKLDYWADTVFQFNRGKEHSTFFGVKDRAFGFDDGKSHPVDVAAIKAVIGPDMDRPAVPLKMSTRDQQIDITHYVNQLGMTQDQLNMSLRKYDVRNVDELTYEDAETILNKLKEKQ